MDQHTPVTESDSFQDNSAGKAANTSWGERRAKRRAMLKQRRQNRSTLQRAILLGVEMLLISAFCCGGVFAYQYVNVIVNRPEDAFFTPPKDDPVKPTANVVFTPGVAPGKHWDRVDDDPYAALSQNADNSIITDGILNILIIGVDYADERVSSDWTGKRAFHADVMMVLAINFKEGTADLISLPRDTYANIPDVEGIYKLNASLDCGGGMTESGYEKVCQAAEWMLGGIPVDYYYAVTMPVVKRLGDAVGGVYFDVDMDFSMAGREYKAGLQHLDGQGILDYLRVRKNVAQSGDLNRINRQKRMLVALFNSMKRSDKLKLIPEILRAFGSDVATNTTIQQSMALTLWALKLDPDNIGMYSMGGSIERIFGWNFCLTDQKNRVKVIKEVYGINVEPYLEYSEDYAHYRWQSMLYEQALLTTEGIADQVGELIAADYPLPSPTPDQPPASQSPDETPPPASAPSPTPLYDAEQRAIYETYLTAFSELEEAYNVACEEAELYLDEKPNELSQSVNDLSWALDAFRTAAAALKSNFKLNVKFEWDVEYWLDPEFNEIEVDFR